jgi:hypothetical protein
MTPKIYNNDGFYLEERVLQLALRLQLGHYFNTYLSVVKQNMNKLNTVNVQ